MTVEEAKKLLEKEGYTVGYFGKPIVPGRFTRYENPIMCEAMDIVCSAGYFPMMEPSLLKERKARLKKEIEEYHNALVPDEEEGKEENPSLTFEEAKDFARKDYIEHMERPISRKKERKEDNPALKEAASQFNDALLDEQAKKIEEFTKKNVRLGEEIARLNKIIYKKNMKIEELRKESSRHLRGKVKLFGETVDLMEALRKTESLLNDTREANSKNLDTCFKNEDIIDDLKKKLAEKTKLVKKYAKELSDSSLDLCKLEKKLKDKNAILSDVAEELRLTKIREKNLAELGLKYVGENEKLKKELADKVVDKIDAQSLKSAESALAYKDEVIETLDKELAEAKHELSSLKRPFRPDSTEAVVLFANAYAKAERKHLPCTDWRNDGKEVSATYILENGKKSKIALDFTGDEIIFSRTDPDKPRKDPLYSYKDKQLAEKDEVIADLCNELAATKKELEEKTNLVEIVRNASKDYCDYGVAANEFIKKLANLYVIAGSKGTISNKMFERCKNYQSYGFPAKYRVETKKEIDSIARGKENKKK